MGLACAKGKEHMTGIEVVVGSDESLEQVLRRFKRRCESSGLKGEIRRHQFYEKPSVRARKKAAAARRNALRKARRRRGPR
jgi:small subunit ribosomal protein S21